MDKPVLRTAQDSEQVQTKSLWWLVAPPVIHFPLLLWQLIFSWASNCPKEIFNPTLQRELSLCDSVQTGNDTANSGAGTFPFPALWMYLGEGVIMHQAHEGNAPEILELQER